MADDEISPEDILAAATVGEWGESLVGFDLEIPDESHYLLADYSPCTSVSPGAEFTDGSPILGRMKVLRVESLDYSYWLYPLFPN